MALGGSCLPQLGALLLVATSGILSLGPEAQMCRSLLPSLPEQSRWGDSTCFMYLSFRMMEIAKAMRLKISKRKVSLAAGREEDHKLGTLSIPLPPAQTSDRQSKRKRIS